MVESFEKIPIQIYPTPKEGSIFVAGEIDLTAQLAMSTERTRSVDAKGAVTFGPLSLTGGFNSSLKQTTATNLSIHVVLARQSRSSALSYKTGTAGSGQNNPGSRTHKPFPMQPFLIMSLHWPGLILL